MSTPINWQTNHFLLLVMERKRTRMSLFNRMKSWKCFLVPVAFIFGARVFSPQREELRCFLFWLSRKADWLLHLDANWAVCLCWDKGNKNELHCRNKISLSLEGLALDICARGWGLWVCESRLPSRAPKGSHPSLTTAQQGSGVLLALSEKYHLH